jgi:hypothetical protein
MTQCDKCGAESKLEFQVGDKVDALSGKNKCIGGLIERIDHKDPKMPYYVNGTWDNIGVYVYGSWCYAENVTKHVPKPAEGTGEWAVQKGLEGCCLRHDTMIEGKFIKYIAGKWMWQNGEACLPPINSWWNSIRGERRSNPVVWSIHEELSLETKVRRCLDVLRLQVRPLNQDAEQIIALVRDNDRKSFLNLEEKLQSAEMGLSTVSAQLEASDRKVKELERQTQDQYNEIIKLSTEAVKKNNDLDYWRRKIDDLRVKLVQARNY